MKIPTTFCIDGSRVWIDWRRLTASVSIRRSDGTLEHHLLDTADAPGAPLEFLPIALCERIERDRGATPPTCTQRAATRSAT